MSGIQHNESHTLNWSDEGELIPATQSLGQVIDGFRQLSNEDKGLFLRLFNLQVRSAASVVAGGALAPTVVPTVLPAAQQAPLAVQPAHTTLPVVQGAHAAQLAALGQPGYTLDPKSGKTYRVVAKAARSQEFLGLENNALRAKQALDAYMKRHSLRFDRKSNLTVGPNAQPFTPTQEYSGLVDRVKTSNLAVKAYKQAHPDEFRPPQKKGNKTQKQGLPTGLMVPPPPLGGSTHQVGDVRNQGSSTTRVGSTPLIGADGRIILPPGTSASSVSGDLEALMGSPRATKSD